MIRCINGHDNADASAFCSTCGQSLTAAPAVPANAETPAAETSAMVEPPETTGGRERRRAVLLTAVGIVVLVAVGATLALRPSTEDRYLTALEVEGVRAEFSTQVAAVRNAERLCEELADGGDAVGSDADRIGVEHYCAEFADDFRVLQSATITGQFALTKSGGRYNTFARQDDGEVCLGGTGGYGDISPTTTVTLTNLQGVPLDRTVLGAGEIAGRHCVFSFELEVTEGEDAYVLAVGRRGEFTYSFGELTAFGAVSLSLG